MTNDEQGSDDESVLQVRIIFKLAPECTDRSLQVPSDVIAVPADAGRKQLSAVLNHLLDRATHRPDDDEEDTDKPPAIPFECIVGGTNRLLRTGIEREARRSGVKLEEAIPVTYFPAQAAPEASGESEPQPDWISSLSYIPSRNLLCAGCYDGSILVFEDGKAFAPVATKSLAHQGPIQCLSTISNGSMVWIATGSMDHTLRLHTMHSSGHDVTLQAACKGGHTSAITSVDLHSHAMTLASGDWDGNLCLWDFSATTTASVVDDAPVSKKSKTAVPGATAQPQPNHTLSPTTSLRAHSSNISGISWGNHAMNSETSSLSHLITGSWDHSIKVWDMDRQDCLLTLNVSRVVSCLDTSYHSSGVVATGHPDCTVRLWDTRTDQSTDSIVVADTTFRPSHKEWITAVQWSRSNPFHLASTSHDGTVKLWDIRSPLPLHTYRAFGKKDKGLSLSYGGRDDVMYVGGTDCIVRQLICANES